MLVSLMSKWNLTRIPSRHYPERARNINHPHRPAKTVRQIRGLDNHYVEWIYFAGRAGHPLLV
jgi:hypothetical protein